MVTHLAPPFRLWNLSLWYRTGKSRNRKLLRTGNNDFHPWACLLDLSSFISTKIGRNQILCFILTTQRRRAECGKLIFLAHSQPLPPPGCISDQGRQITFPSCLTPNYPSEWRERESFDKVWKSASAFLSTSGWICQASCNSRFLLKTIREHPAQTGSIWVFVGPSAMAVHLEGPVFAVGVPSSARWIISSLEKVALPAHINASLLHELGTNIGI